MVAAVPIAAVPNRCSGPYSTREKASDAMVAGSSRACSRFVSRCCRCRSSSAAGNVGRSATSAMIGSASARRATGTCRRTADESMPLDAFRSAPRKSIASASSSAASEPAPSVSIAAVRLAAPYLPGGSLAVPVRTTRFTCTTGTSCSSTIQTGRPFASCRFTIVGSLRAGAGPLAGGFDRSGACPVVTTPHRAIATIRRNRFIGADPYGLSGMTVNSTRRSAGRNATAAARISAGASTRYRPRSSLNQSGLPVSEK